MASGWSVQNEYICPSIMKSMGVCKIDINPEALIVIKYLSYLIINYFQQR